jgi:hypothetical protein
MRRAMGCNDYHFLSRWRVEGTIAEVAAISRDIADVLRWWPAVYLGLQQVEPGDENRVGLVVKLFTRGWLPYRLRWYARVVEVDYPRRFVIEAWGDLVGRGVCTLEQKGAWTVVTYDWRVRAEKPLLRALSCLLRPLFALNHRWAMATGERSLQREVARRHAAQLEEAGSQSPIH